MELVKVRWGLGGCGRGMGGLGRGCYWYTGLGNPEGKGVEVRQHCGGRRWPIVLHTCVVLVRTAAQERPSGGVPCQQRQRLAPLKTCKSTRYLAEKTRRKEAQTIYEQRACGQHCWLMPKQRKAQGTQHTQCRGNVTTQKGRAACSRNVLSVLAAVVVKLRYCYQAASVGLLYRGCCGLQIQGASSKPRAQRRRRRRQRSSRGCRLLKHARGRCLRCRQSCGVVTWCSGSLQLLQHLLLGGCKEPGKGVMLPTASRGGRAGGSRAEPCKGRRHLIFLALNLLRHYGCSRQQRQAL